MLSVIVYGRNDSHGYNLHKRAAISLNAIAEVLTAPDDEILFVDYNTPDDFPTFVEAIHDTLTARAKDVLRVLRVRPAHHQRYLGRTHLPIIEPVARNIALRRSNPQNRWVLATNSDMVFVPRRAGESLSDIAAGLPDGFFELPRFELPETLWESLDRREPADIIARVRRWGARLHLNDVVLGDDTILYDAPGDFQLALRADLFAIDGFDEEMILGWHIDSNIAKRMTLWRGRISSALPHLFGYHCDHTRQSDVMHGRDRMENDLHRFVAQVSVADLPAQRATWGQPESDIEEVDLRGGVSQRYVGALEHALPPMPADFHQSHYRSENYNDLSYVPEHVLPYICDQLASLPRDRDLLYVGCRARLLTLLAKAWRELGFTGDILVPDECDWLTPDMRTGPVRHHSLAALEPQTGYLLFEFGLGSQDKEDGDDGKAPDHPRAPDEKISFLPQDRDRLAVVRELYLETVQAEAQRQSDGGAARRFIGVNAINNEFERLIQDTLSFTYTPFSSRTRHGYVVAEKPTAAPRADPRSLGAWLKTALGRAQPGPIGESAGLLRLLRALTALPTEKTLPDEAGILATPLLAALRFPSIRLLAPMGDAVFDSLPARIAAVRASQRHTGGLRVKLRDDPPPAGPRAGFPSVHDWEDPRWFAHAARHFGGLAAYSVFERGRWMWQRVSILHALDELGCLSKAARILVCIAVPEELLAILPGVGCRVDVLGTARDPDGFLKAAPDGTMPKGVFKGDRLTFLAGGRDVEAGRYDAVIIPHGAAMLDETAGIPGLLRDAERALKPGGVVGFMIDVALAEARYPSQLAPQLAGRLRPLVEQHTGLRGAGNFRDTLSPETFDRTEQGGDATLALNHFVDMASGGPKSEALWLFRKQGDTPAAGWSALGEELFRLAPPAIWSRMRPGAGVVRSDSGVSVDASFAGSILFGPHVRLQAGSYRLAVNGHADAVADPDAPVMTIEVAAAEVGATVLRDITARELSGLNLTIDFVIPERYGAGTGIGAHWEFRISSHGGVGLALSGLTLGKVGRETLAARPPAATRPLLARMRLTDIARRQADAIAVVPGSEPGCWLYGPYLPLPQGRHELVFRCAAAEGRCDETVLAVETVLRDRRLGRLEEYSAAALRDPVRLPFTLRGAEPGFLSDPVEFRFWYRGPGALLLTELLVRPCDQA